MTHIDTVGTPARNTNNRGRAWCITLNNWNNNDLTHLTHYLSGGQYLIGEEIGKNGTPHLQGVFRLKNAVSFNALKDAIPKAHIEPCKNWKASIQYCKKDGKFHTNILTKKRIEDEYNEFMQKKYSAPIWRQFQKEILEIIDTPPDDRTIYWYWDEKGNSGKSFLCKYIEWKYPTIIANGKQSDIYNGIKCFLEEKKTYPKVILIDCPRCNSEYISYTALEKIKDGLFYSGKYEGGIIRLLPCHVFVFANCEPDYSKFSQDRYIVKGAVFV